VTKAYDGGLVEVEVVGLLVTSVKHCWPQLA
jgi:hypothetical protein